MSEHTATLPAEKVSWSKEQIDLIKRTVAKGASDDELALFLYQAKRTGLDPLTKQIHAIKRWSSRDGREVMSIQTGIDGYRLIADRTGVYTPGRETVYGYEPSGNLESATAYIKKLVGQEWHEVSATAFYTEYLQTTKEGKPMGLWAKMPRLMLAKCAEALALRRAFPAELSGLYTIEEMSQADSEQPIETKKSNPVPSAMKETKESEKDPKGSFFGDFIRFCEDAKTVLGEPAYRQILGGNGFEHANEAKGKGKARKLAKDLLEFMRPDGRDALLRAHKAVLEAIGHLNA